GDGAGDTLPTLRTSATRHPARGRSVIRTCVPHGMSRITAEREVAPAAQRFTTTLEHVLPGSCRDLRASDIFRSFKFEFPLWQLPRYPAFCPVNLRQEVLVAIACKH